MSEAAPALDARALAALRIVYVSSARFMWEQPHEWVPLVILALVPSGRVWGYDRRLVQRERSRAGTWPF